MKASILTKIKKHWITIWLVMSLLALGSLIAYAAYTSVSRTTRVITTKAGEGVCFSSNYLAATSGNKFHTQSIPIGSGNPSVIYFDVCNYPKTNISHFSNDDIYYNITAQLTDVNGASLKDAIDAIKAQYPDNMETILRNFTFSVDGETVKNFFDNADSEADSEYIITLSEQKLDGGLISSKTYKITMNDYEPDEFELPDIYVTVKATPDSNRNQDSSLPEIGAVFDTISFTNVSVNDWKGVFTDAFAEQGSTRRTKDYDGFNYRISGNGAGKITLTWNTNYVEISPWFLSEIQSISGTSYSGDANTKITQLIFYVDSSTDKNQYDIPFYRTQDPPVSEEYRTPSIYADGTEQSIYVHCDFEATKESDGSE